MLDLDSITKENGKCDCPECGKEYSRRFIKQHIFYEHTKEGNLVKLEKARKHSIKMKGRKGHKPWSAGKTKHSDDKLKRMSERLSESCKGRFISEEQKLKQRNTMLEKYKNGFDPKCGRAPKYKYESPIAGIISVDGSWELNVAKHLDNLGVAWKRNTERFDYINLDNKKSTYCPDFYIYDWDSYIEVKGYQTELDDCKWSQFKHNLLIWDRSVLSQKGIIGE